VDPIGPGGPDGPVRVRIVLGVMVTVEMPSVIYIIGTTMAGVRFSVVLNDMIPWSIFLLVGAS
jgi:phosphoenolpyruvate-protein kinase (PTS system EI component)